MSRSSAGGKKTAKRATSRGNAATRSSATPRSNVTVYAFARAPVHSDLGRGAQREKLELVTFGRVSAIVGSVKQRPSVEESQLLSHDAVIRRLNADLDGVLPVRFGTYEPRSSVLASLETREPAFRDALKSLRGAEQMVLHLFAKAGVTPPPPEIAEPASAGPGARYLHARFAEHVKSRSVPELDSLRGAFERLIRAERVRRADTAEGLLATVYHLVPRSRLERYRRLFSNAELPARLVLRGPFPPYAFGPEAGT